MHYHNGSNCQEPKGYPSLQGKASATFYCEVGLVPLVDKLRLETLVVLLGAPDGPSKKKGACPELIGPKRDYRGAVVNDTCWLSIDRKR